MRLSSQPTANVTVGLSSSNPAVGTVSPATLTFTPINWNVAQTVTVQGVGNDPASGDQAYTIVTAPAVSADSTYNGLNAADVSVTNHPLSRLTINDVTADLNNLNTTTAVFTVMLAPASPLPVSVRFTTADGTAAQPGDYTATSGTLNFAPGQTTKTITVPLKPTIEIGLDKTFTVNLSDANNAQVVKGQGTATLTNSSRSIVVTTTADTVANDGQTSLREAILFADEHAGITISFHISNRDPHFSNGVYTIQPVSALPLLTNNGTILDGTTQRAFTGDTNRGGPEILLDGSQAGAHVDGLEIDAANCVVKGLVINSFTGSGVRIAGAAAANDLLQGCFIGTDPTGTAGVSNGSAGVVLINGAQRNTVGGVNANARNLISGNAGDGIVLDGANNNFIFGNFIGTDTTGTQTVPNLLNGIEVVRGATNNQIGGSPAGGDCDRR